MKKQNRYIAVGAAFGMYALILDGSTAIQGARDGITLCLTTLIPSLYPFIFLSALLTGVLSGQELRLLRPIARFCNMPAGSEQLLAVGFLGGYPVGAQNVRLLKEQGQFSDETAMRLLPFCNNAGPSFIFGILGPMFSDAKTPWLLWLVHIMSALLVGRFLPGSNCVTTVRPQQQDLGIISAFNQAIRAMASICGWVVLMRMILTFMEVWFLRLMPLPLQTLTAGILELSNGCIRLSELPCEGLRFLIASALLSIGGICVTLQTASVSAGISLKLYFPGKVLQCAISVIISSLLQLTFPAAERWNCGTTVVLALFVFFIILLFLKHSEKSSGIPAIVSV